MSISKTIDTALVLKALGAETSGTDGAGTALDLAGNWDLITALIHVTVVAGSPPSALDLEIEGSSDNVNWFVVAKAPRLTTVGLYVLPIFNVAAADRVSELTTSAAFAFRKRPRYLRSKSTVTAGTGGDSVTYSVHLSA